MWNISISKLSVIIFSVELLDSDSITHLNFSIYHRAYLCPKVRKWRSRACKSNVLHPTNTASSQHFSCTFKLHRRVRSCRTYMCHFQSEFVSRDSSFPQQWHSDGPFRGEASLVNDHAFSIHFAQSQEAPLFSL